MDRKSTLIWQSETEIKPCEWCEYPSKTNKDGLCGTCQVISTPVRGLRPSQIPHFVELHTFNSFLEPTRSLSDEERLLHLKKLMPIDSIPASFRPRSKLKWPDESALIWKKIRQDLQAGREPTGISLPLPMGSSLKISNSGRMSIAHQWRKKSVQLQHAPPLLDIAMYLEDQDRAKEVRYWDKLIMALSVCAPTLEEGDTPDGGWFSKYGWRGMDTPQSTPSPFTSGWEPACFRFLTLLFPDFDEEEDCIGYLIRRNLAAFEWLGTIGIEWLSAFEDEGSLRHHMYGTDIHPRLVNIRNKLHILILRGGSPTPIPVPLDSRLLTTLVTIVLQPCNTKTHKFLEALFWIFDSELEPWLPSPQDIKGAKLLRAMVESLGDRSSIEPIPLTPLGGAGIFIQGDSNLGLCYCISPSRAFGKFTVSVALSRDDLRWDLASQDICIDLNKPDRCVAADHAVSYLLALANDSHSRDRISTLNALMSCAETTLERAPASEDTSTRWGFVTYCFNHDCEDTDFEDYDEMINALWDSEPEDHTGETEEEI